MPTSGTRLALVEKTRECDFVEGVIQQIRGRWAAHRPKLPVATLLVSGSSWLLSGIMANAYFQLDAEVQQLMINF